MWIPPHRFESWAEHPWNQPRIQALADDGGHRYDEFCEWVESRSPSTPIWQLESIAVDPRLQGRGIGGALILEGQERAGAEGKGAFLSTATERNVSIYGRFGCRVIDDAYAPNAGPAIWFMRWDP